MNACARSHIVVTGASSGIGRPTALHLAAAGHHVFAGVRQLADAPPAPPATIPGEITPLLPDVTDPAQIGAAVGAVAGHRGGRQARLGRRTAAERVRRPRLGAL